jgi:hypothetical protein
MADVFAVLPHWAAIERLEEQALHAFEEGHDEAFKQFRKDLSAALPNVWQLEVQHRHR